MCCKSHKVARTDMPTLCWSYFQHWRAQKVSKAQQVCFQHCRVDWRWVNNYYSVYLLRPVPRKAWSKYFLFVWWVYTKHLKFLTVIWAIWLGWMHIIVVQSRRNHFMKTLLYKQYPPESVSSVRGVILVPRKPPIGFEFTVTAFSPLNFSTQ